MRDAWRAYLELAFGLTEATRKKAGNVAKDMFGKGAVTTSQVQTFVDDLVSTSRINRDGLVRLVRYEVDRALGAVGLASADEVSQLTTRVQELERQLREAQLVGARTGTQPDSPAAEPAQPVAKKAPANKAPANKATAKKAVAKKAVAKPAPATQPAAKQTATKKTTPTKASPASPSDAGGAAGTGG